MASPIDHSKKRKINWVASETQCLISEVECRSALLFASFSSSTTNRKKACAWEEIASKVSACGSCRRTPADVKKKWTTLKSEARKKACAHKKLSCLTGGGPAPHPLTDFEEKIVSLIPNCLVEGCAGGIESEEDNVTVPSFEIEDGVPVEDALLTLVPPPPPPQASTSQATPPLTYQGDEWSMDMPKCIPKRSTSTAHQSSHGEQLLDIEHEKLDLMRKALEVDRQRLKIEKEILQELKHISGSSSFCVSPIIQL